MSFLRMLSLLVIFFVFNIKANSHETRDVSLQSDSSDSFVLDEVRAHEQNLHLDFKIKNLLERITKLTEERGRYPRNIQFVKASELTELQKNAAADILLETIDISLDMTEAGVSCTSCKEEIPLTYRAMIKESVRHFRNILSQQEGTSFQRLESFLSNMVLNSKIKKDFFINDLIKLLKSMGIKVSGDLAEIYGEKGSLALALVFATWMPYTVVSEAIEHSLIGPFAVFCMTSQFFYFAVINSIFDFFINVKDVVSFRLFSKNVNNFFSDYLRLINFELNLKFKFTNAISKNGKQYFTAKKLKKSLRIDAMSRVENVLIGFHNYFQKKLFQLELKKDFQQKKLNKIRLDAFLYEVLKTHIWADVAVLYSYEQMGLGLKTDKMNDGDTVDQIMIRLVDEGRRDEILFLIKEMFMVVDLLRKYVSGHLRLMREEGEISVEEYFLMKKELGRMYRFAQKTKFIMSLNLSNVVVSKRDILDVIFVYKETVSEFSRFYSFYKEKNYRNEEDLSHFRDFLSLSRTNRSRLLYGEVSSCHSFFLSSIH